MAIPAPREAAPPEVLFWYDAVLLSGESRPPAAGERGHVVRLHADAGCTARLAPGTTLVSRRTREARADALCRLCTSEIVLTSSSSVLRRLRDAEHVLRALLQTVGDPVPREIVHCRALRHEAEHAASVHPDVQALAGDVAQLAGEVAEELREGLRALVERTRTRT